MILDPRIAAFVEWFAAFQQRFGRTLESAVVPAEVDLRVPLALTTSTTTGDDASRAIARALAAAELAHRLENGIKPVIASLRQALEAAAERISNGLGIGEYLADLQREVEQMPEEYELRDVQDERETMAMVPLRAWLEAMVVNEAGPAMTGAVAAAGDEIRVAMVELERMQKVLDYYLLAVQRHTGDGDQPTLTEDFAQAGLQRTRVLLDQFRARRRAGALRIRAAFVRRMSNALEDACGPLHGARADDIVRKLTALAEAERDRDLPPPTWQQWRERLRGVYGRSMPVVREVARDLRLLFANQELPRDDGHRRLVTIDFDRLGAELPPSYRRLFSGVPTEIADIYVPRARIEVQCRDAIARWLHGTGDSLLLHGDRGAGKRTLINQVLAGFRSAVPVHWARLSRDVNSEPDFCRTVGREIDIGTPATFAALEKALRAAPGRRALVVENSEIGRAHV